MGIFIFLILTLSLIIGAHFIVYFALIHFWQIPETLTLKLWTLGLILSFIILSVLTNFFYHKILGVAYAISAFLLGTIYWLFWASVIGFALYFIFRFLHLPFAGVWIGKIL